MNRAQSIRQALPEAHRLKLLMARRIGWASPSKTRYVQALQQKQLQTS